MIRFRRRRLEFYACAVLLGVGACTAVRPVTPPLKDNTRDILVRFAEPRNLDARTRAGAPVVLHRVRELRGRVLDAAGDTLVLMVAAARTFELWEGFSPALVVTLRTSDAGLRIGERYLSARRTTMAMVVGPPVIAWTLFFLACGVLGPCWT